MNTPIFRTIRVNVTMAKRSVGLMSRKGIKLQLHKIQYDECDLLIRRQPDHDTFYRLRKTVPKIQEMACFVNKMERISTRRFSGRTFLDWLLIEPNIGSSM